MATNHSHDPESGSQKHMQGHRHWQCPGTSFCQVMFTFAENASGGRGRIIEAFQHASDGMEECFSDLHSFLLNGFVEAEEKFNTRWWVDSTDDLKSEDQNDCSTWALSCVFPGYFPKSWIMKFTVVESLVYAYEVLGQPSSLSWQTWLYNLGAAYGPAIAYSDEWWRFLTPVFLHGHFQHLACNVLIQCRLGYRTERILGGFRFCILYLGSGMIANLVSIAIDPFKISVGASTALFGLLGSNMVLSVLSWQDLSNRHKTLFAVFVILTGVGLVWTPLNVDFIGHFAGLISGACLTLLLLPDRERDRYLLPPFGEAGSVRERIALLSLGGGMAASSFLLSHMALP